MAVSSKGNNKFLEAVNYIIDWGSIDEIFKKKLLVLNEKSLVSPIVIYSLIAPTIISSLTFTLSIIINIDRWVVNLLGL